MRANDVFDVVKQDFSDSHSSKRATCRRGKS